jgi:hypothetical protein
MRNEFGKLSDSPDAAGVEEAQRTLKVAASSLDDIDAPDDVADLHENLVDLLNDAAFLFDELGPLMAEATNDPSSLDEADLKFINGATERLAGLKGRLTDIGNGYKAKDYDLGLGTAFSGGPDQLDHPTLSSGEAVVAEAAPCGTTFETTLVHGLAVTGVSCDAGAVVAAEKAEAHKAAHMKDYSAESPDPTGYSCKVTFPPTKGLPVVTCTKPDVEITFVAGDYADL